MPPLSAHAADPFFKKGENCEETAAVEQATVLVDCAAYYRALHQSICKAQRSIFILGWDIDSRVLLLRGIEAQQTAAPARFFDLICWVANNNPELQIYLNRWSYSSYLLLERELFAPLKWIFKAPANVHFFMDATVPLGASHHQKVVVIDDEVAFCGGMDVARCRWDHRQHHPVQPHRHDPASNHRLGHEEFGPYHDTQIVFTGALVQTLARLVRDRWQTATGKHPLTLAAPTSTSASPVAWPEGAKVHLRNMPAGLAYTIPPQAHTPAIRHVEALYFDMIKQAKSFIYMENQYFCQQDIAAALNAQLKAEPGLRVLLVSSYNPQGIFEKKAMWTLRLEFIETASAGVEDRIVLTYPVSQEQGKVRDVRIHSKLMIVDGDMLRIGSSNINNRSMGLDTECDIVVKAPDAEGQAAIIATRNDLIREHTGYEIEDITRIIDGHEPVRRLLDPLPHSRQHLREAQDEPYRKERFVKFAQWLADRKEPII